MGDYNKMGQADRSSLAQYYIFELIEKRRNLTPSEKATKTGIKIFICGYTTDDLPKEVRLECEKKVNSLELGCAGQKKKQKKS